MLPRDSDSWGSIASLVGSMLAAGFAPNAVTVSMAGKKIYDTFASTIDYNKKYWAIHEHLNPVLWSFLMMHRVHDDVFLLQRGRWDVVWVFRGGHKYSADEPQICIVRAGADPSLLKSQFFKVESMKRKFDLRVHEQGKYGWTNTGFF